MQKTSLETKSTAQNANRSAIDWDLVRSRARDASTSNGEEISQAALEQAWARRSAQIARKIQSEQQGEVVKAAIVSMDGELYGLDVQYIFDIRAIERITFVPRVPGWVLGVVNWRGRVLSVIDLRRFLGLPPNKNTETSPSADQRLLVLQAAGMEVGIQADDVFLIDSIPVSKIDTSNDAVRAIKPEFVKGLFIRTAHEASQLGMVVLLNLPALLADPRLVIRDEIL